MKRFANMDRQPFSNKRPTILEYLIKNIFELFLIYRSSALLDFKPAESALSHVSSIWRTPRQKPNRIWRGKFMVDHLSKTLSATNCQLYQFCIIPIVSLFTTLINYNNSGKQILIDWLIEWWLLDWLCDWLTDWLTEWLTDWLLIDWMIDSPFEFEGVSSLGE